MQREAGARNGFAEPRDRAPKIAAIATPRSTETARPSFEPRKSPQIGAYSSETGNRQFVQESSWARQDSNLQPSGYEPLALTIELRARYARRALRTVAAPPEAHNISAAARVSFAAAAPKVAPADVCGPFAQGNRVKDLCGEEAGEEVVVPGGHFAFEAQ